MFRQEPHQSTVLAIETYPHGSHGRVLALLQRHSTFRIDDIQAAREHWRWLAMAAHFDIIEHIRQSHMPRPDIIFLSGPINVAALVAMLPSSWSTIPRVIYFHESQWTYPAEEYDARPYLLAHLNAIQLCDEAWFNSHFHLDTFWQAAMSPAVDNRIRSLVKRVEARLRARCAVVYPPVSMDVIDHVPGAINARPRILWNARWEIDKRPDRFVKLLDLLVDEMDGVETLVLGTSGRDVAQIAAQLGRHAATAILPGHLARRAEYEALLSTANISVSTADHEFFGIAAIEAVMAGAIPVLPANLAYPETLPSAYYYRPGDIEDLVRVVTHLLQHPPSGVSVQSDASRFLPQRTVPEFDARWQRLIESSRG